MFYFTLLFFVFLTPFYPIEPCKPYLSVLGHINMRDGLGKHSVEISSLLHNDISVEIVPTHPVVHEDLPNVAYRLMSRSTSPQGKVILFFDARWPPLTRLLNPYIYTELAKSTEKIRIAYVMFETTKISPEWANHLNTYFDLVCVPDSFYVDVFKNSGVNIPIFELPLAIDIKDFLSKPLKRKANTPFVFANFGMCQKRKNQKNLVKGFVKAFGANNQNVKLIINCRAGDFDAIEEIKKEIENAKTNNIVFNINCRSREEYVKMFQEIDCFVSLSKGEGFSIQPREAMALGIPVVVTDNTAQHTVCQSGLTSCVPSKIIGCDGHGYAISGYDFDCKVEDVSKSLLDVYNNYDKYLSNSETAREWARQYDCQSLKHVYMNIIKPKRVFFGDFNEVTKDHLITNSRSLYEKWKKTIDQTFDDCMFPWSLF